MRGPRPILLRNRSRRHSRAKRSRKSSIDFGDPNPEVIPLVSGDGTPVGGGGRAKGQAVGADFEGLMTWTVEGFEE